MLHGEILTPATTYQQSDERTKLIFSVLFTWDLMLPQSSLTGIREEDLLNTVKPNINICVILFKKYEL